MGVAEQSWPHSNFANCSTEASLTVEQLLFYYLIFSQRYHNFFPFIPFPNCVVRGTMH